MKTQAKIKASSPTSLDICAHSFNDDHYALPEFIRTGLIKKIKDFLRTFLQFFKV